MTQSANTIKKQKRWIVILLAISCLSSIILFFVWSPDSKYQLQESSEIDSLITLSFTRFHIPGNQIRSQTVRIDPDFSRTVYFVNVPPGFSQTRFHFELNEILRLYGLQTPATVEFPDQDVRIHITHGSTVVRTVQLQTDPNLILYRDFASLIIGFDRPPRQSQMDRIIALGEPLTIAIRSAVPHQDFEAVRQLRREYPHIAWWLRNSEGIDYSQPEQMQNFLNQLNRLNQVDNGARVLFFSPYEEGQTIPESVLTGFRRQDLQIITTGDALLLSDLGNTARIEETTDLLLQRSSVRNPPILILEGTDSNILQLQSYISRLKQENIQLRNLVPTTF